MIKSTPFKSGIAKPHLELVILQEISSNPNGTNMANIYNRVNVIMNKFGQELSIVGKNNIRVCLNRELKKLVSRNKRDLWTITPEGSEALKSREIQKTKETNDVKFELFCKKLLEGVYPKYAWHYRGKDKIDERGLDLIGKPMSEDESKIGVQVKLYQPYAAPDNRGWDKFLAGCFLRNVKKSIFITTGILNRNQHKEAQWAGVTVISGIEEINRLAREYNITEFKQNESSTKI